MMTIIKSYQMPVSRYSVEFGHERYDRIEYAGGKIIWQPTSFDGDVVSKDDNNALYLELELYFQKAMKKHNEELPKIQ